MGRNLEGQLSVFEPPITWSRIDIILSFTVIFSSRDDHDYHLRLLSCRFPRTSSPGRSITARHTSCQRRRVPSCICNGKCRGHHRISPRSEVLDQPNLTPPITTTDQALEYKATLEGIDPETEFLMTLYLSPDLTPDEVRRAKAAGIVGSSFATIDSPSSCPSRSQVISKGRHN